tara:strand:- start:526 stop:642 length:117 start_codon:yes stop_codon:yes gene_type:complete
MEIPEIDFANATWAKADWEDYLVQTTKFNQTLLNYKLN